MIDTHDDQTLTTIYRIDDIPLFADEDEEHSFWATHKLSDALWDQAEPPRSHELPPPRSESLRVTIPIDMGTLERVKAVARKQHKEYQVLLREFVTERLAEEEKQREASGAP